ncbi:MAG: hypothetical protein WCH98_13080, partial [Verrucomicrobiota bacterium]
MKRVLTSFIFFALLIAAWELAARSGRFSQVMFPPPSNVAKYLWEASADGTLGSATLVTIKRLLVGYAIGLLLGIPLGLFTAKFRLFQDTVGVAASSGAAVKLANNVTFAGFDINNTTGIGIIGSGINGATVRDIRINETTGVDSHGVYLLNTTGVISFQRMNITDTIGG